MQHIRLPPSTIATVDGGTVIVSSEPASRSGAAREGVGMHAPARLRAGWPSSARAVPHGSRRCARRCTPAPPLALLLEMRTASFFRWRVGSRTVVQAAIEKVIHSLYLPPPVQLYDFQVLRDRARPIRTRPGAQIPKWPIWPKTTATSRGQYSKRPHTIELGTGGPGVVNRAFRLRQVAFEP